MPSFYLQSIDDNGGTTTKSFDSCYVDEVVDYLDDFLKGSGFAFDELKVIQNNSSKTSTKPTFLREEYVNPYRGSQSVTD